MTSRLTVRIVVAVIGVVVIGYIIHLQSQIASLEGRLAQSGTPGAAAPAAAPPREGHAPQQAPASQSQVPQSQPPRAPAEPRTLTASQREAMIVRLGGRNNPDAPPVWFATVPNNREAAEFQRQLQAVFEEAGWQVKGNAPIKFAMKAGIYLFSADEEPPPYVANANDALEAAGFTVSAGRGYREFYRQKKEENPSWVGIELAPDQTYVIAIGRQPEDAPGA